MVMLNHRSGVTLPGVFKRHPIDEINLPLWTLSSEWCCYLLALFVTAGTQWRRTVHLNSRFSLALLSILAVITAEMFPLPYIYAYKWAAFFVVGGVCFFLRRQIRLYPRCSVALFAASIILIRFAPLAGKALLPLSLCYLLLSIGFHPEWYASWFEGCGDFSYGLYIYAWPIQQVFSEHIVAPVALFFSSYLAVLPLAAASWYLVESRCIAWRHGRAAEKSVLDIAQPAAPASA
jgi:peptidoglycan/LPS O-acetylase OafA/YrhL